MLLKYHQSPERNKVQEYERVREWPREALLSITQTPRAENKAARFAGAGEVRARSMVCRSVPSPSEEAGPWAAVTVPWL